MYDRPKVDQMLANLQRYERVLRNLAASSQTEFLASGDKIGNAKYHFVVAIECCLDIANHIIAAEGFRLPQNNADAFLVLAEHGVLPPGLVETLRGMARFRNRLVHMYWEVDDEAVFGYLQTNLHDFSDFMRAIAGWLAQASGGA